MLEYLVLITAAFLAGIVNTIAGGGTFLTFPALVYAGIPSVAANATSAVAVFPGYLGGAAGFRRELKSFEWRTLLKVVVATVIGGLVGSLLLLVSSSEAFSAIVPCLLLMATLVFAFGDRIQALARKNRFGVQPNGMTGTVLVSIYGGYFNGGLGIVLLALFSLCGMKDINAMNGLKNGLSFVLSAISVATFAAAGIVAWPQALAMMIAAIMGGLCGGADCESPAGEGRSRYRRSGWGRDECDILRPPPLPRMTSPHRCGATELMSNRSGRLQQGALSLGECRLALKFVADGCFRNPHSPMRQVRVNMPYQTLVIRRREAESDDCIGVFSGVSGQIQL